jgi:hypothetical protein
MFACLCPFPAGRLVIMKRYMVPYFKPKEFHLLCFFILL